MRPARLALCLGALTATLVTGAVQAQTAFVARTTTITGTFQSGSEVLTIRAETRLRAVASATPANPLGAGINPAETTTTLFVCNQLGCGSPSNRICVAPGATVDEELTGQGKIHILSRVSNCAVDISATLDNPRPPQASASSIESTSAAVFDAGSTIRGSTVQGTDGKVVRAVSWFAG